MNKKRYYGYAIIGIIGLLGTSPMNIKAADTNTESITLSEKKNDNDEKKAAIKAKLKKANEQWNTLTNEQKQEVYALLDSEMEIEIQLMDKLVELGVLEKEDVDMLKSHMINKLKRIKESGEFPLMRKKGR